jgi:hypothetical protein
MIGILAQRNPAFVLFGVEVFKVAPQDLRKGQIEVDLCGHARSRQSLG